MAVSAVVSAHKEPSALRAHLQRLEARGLLQHVTAEVDKDWELACIARQVLLKLPRSQRYALQFDRVKGYEMPVVVGALGVNREVYAAGLDTTPDQVVHRWTRAFAQPIDPVIVGDRLPDEVCLEGKAVDLMRLPIPTWTPTKDGAPYLAGGCSLTKDPDTGIRNVAMRRLMLIGKDRLTFNVTSIPRSGPHIPHGYFQQYRVEQRKETMPVAVLIGVDPAIAMVSAARVPYGSAERPMWDFALAGGLRQSPVRMVRGRTVDLEVPEDTEIVLEGYVDPREKVSEGSFGEFIGYMSPKSEKPVLHITAIRMRGRAMYHNIVSQRPPSESMVLQCIGNGCVLYHRLVHDLDMHAVLDVTFSEHLPLTQIVIKVRGVDRLYGHQILQAAWSSFGGSYGKVIILVDEDIDIYDPLAVDWAVQTRSQPHRDTTIVYPTNPLVYDTSAGTAHARYAEDLPGRHPEASKLLIDATKKWPYPDVALPPGEMLAAVEERWATYGLPELPRVR